LLSSAVSSVAVVPSLVSAGLDCTSESDLSSELNISGYQWCEDGCESHSSTIEYHPAARLKDTAQVKQSVATLDQDDSIIESANKRPSINSSHDTGQVYCCSGRCFLPGPVIDHTMQGLRT
jgi:hypothetical protein